MLNLGKTFSIWSQFNTSQWNSYPLTFFIFECFKFVAFGPAWADFSRQIWNFKKLKNWRTMISLESLKLGPSSKYVQVHSKIVPHLTEWKIYALTKMACKVFKLVHVLWYDILGRYFGMILRLLGWKLCKQTPYWSKKVFSLS